MQYRKLGSSGLSVSLVGLGCNNFGERCDLGETRAVVERAFELGVNFFDTADVYGNRGLSEEYLGKALGARRGDALVATKFGLPMGEGPLARGASRRAVFAAAEASLRRLGSDWIDLYQVHVPDAETPIEETLEALGDLVRQGKVRYIGCSNFAGWQLVEALHTARARSVAGFASAQSQYNLLRRGIEAELVPACIRYGVGLLPYFPLANGLLTGKYRRGAQLPPGTRLGESAWARAMELSEANFDRVEALERFAAERGRSLLELAVGWLAARPQVASVIAGARRPEQLEQNCQAADWVLSEEDLAAVDRLG